MASARHWGAHARIGYAEAFAPTRMVLDLAPAPTATPRRRRTSDRAPSLMNNIEKGIRAANIGLNPTNDGKVLRIPIPALTEERRKELSKIVHKFAEEGRNGIRLVRREANDLSRRSIS